MCIWNNNLMVQRGWVEVTHLAKTFEMGSRGIWIFDGMTETCGTRRIYIPKFPPVHVGLVQVAEQQELVFSFSDPLEGAFPLGHGSLLLVLIVQFEALLHLRKIGHTRASVNFRPHTRTKLPFSGPGLVPVCGDTRRSSRKCRGRRRRCCPRGTGRARAAEAAAARPAMAKGPWPTAGDSCRCSEIYMIHFNRLWNTFYQLKFSILYA